MLMLSLFRLVAAAIPWMLNLATWLLARSLNMPRAAGARHRRLRVRAGADDREQGRQGALPDAADASAPVAAAALIACLAQSPPKQRRTAMIHPSTFLSRALLADAVFSGVAARRAYARRRRARALPQSAGSVAARDRAVPDRLYRAGRLARHAVIRAEGAGAARDRRQCRVDARQHRAAVLGRGVAEPARPDRYRGAGDRHRRVRRAAIYRPAQERRRR